MTLLPEIKELFDLNHTAAAELLCQYRYPWEILPALKEYIIKLGNSLSKEDYFQTERDIWISKTACVAESASLFGPLIVGHNTEIRHCAFIRGGVLIGDGAVIGNSCEIKNSLLFDGVQVPHFNYIGDSVLGCNAHFGAGAVTSNLKSDKTPVKIRINGQYAETGLVKLGAIVGDYVEIGCNTVLNPGTVIGKNTVIYPLSSVRGFVPADSIYKTGGITVNRE